MIERHEEAGTTGVDSAVAGASLLGAAVEAASQPPLRNNGTGRRPVSTNKATNQRTSNQRTGTKKISSPKIRARSMYITEKQLNVLNFIRSFIATKKFPPTLNELAQNFNVSKVTIHEHLNALERKGVLRRTRHAARSIELIDESHASPSSPSITVVGDAASASDSSNGSALQIESLKNPERTTLPLGPLLRPGTAALRVTTTKFRDRGVEPGDLLLVDFEGATPATFEGFELRPPALNQPETAAGPPPSPNGGFWTLYPQGKVLAVLRLPPGTASG